MTRATGETFFREQLTEMRRLPVLKLRQTDETLFGDNWVARHNREICRTPEGGMYVNTRAPSLSR